MPLQALNMDTVGAGVEKGRIRRGRATGVMGMSWESRCAIGSIIRRDWLACGIHSRWQDGSINPTRTINLESNLSMKAYYTWASSSSCPSLYLWNGTTYVYVADISNHGWLGYINYIDEDGSIKFWRNNPWDYIKLDKDQLQLRNTNYYDLTLKQKYDEIFYLDSFI